jgi:Fur family ferric uptake transcriptional regulator
VGGGGTTDRARVARAPLTISRKDATNKRMPRAAREGGGVHAYEDHRREADNLEHLRSTLNQYMLKKGLRSTGQRRLILETFFESPNHVSIEELLAKVREQDSKVGYATVYRTLKLLSECGIAYERRFGDGLTRYELAGEHSHHDHLICVECGSITEFEDDRIEALQEKVAARYGYQLRSHKHELYGLCPQCQARRKLD